MVKSKTGDAMLVVDIYTVLAIQTHWIIKN